MTTSNWIYHYLAIKYKNNLWLPFIEKLNLELSKLKGEKLLIFGGSSCACLTTAFLKRFSQITIVDPDRLAPVFFRWHHPGLRVKYVFSDAFSFDGKNLDTLKTCHFLDLYKPDCVLFSNVIGQLPLHYREFYKEKKHLVWAQDLVSVLGSYQWMSFHDTVSYVGNETLDHSTREQAWPRQGTEFSWHITPRQKHLIEIVG